MKIFTVVLVTFLLVIKVNSLAELKNGSSKVKVTMRQCLIDYHIDPAVLDPNLDRDDDLYASLTEEKKGCVTACIYRGFNWLKSDGSLDVDLLTEGETSAESEEEKKKYLKFVDECRAEVGKNDCKFFHCLDTKDI